MSPYSFVFGNKTLITIFIALQSLSTDLKETIIDRIFDSILMEDFLHDYETVSLDDNNWDYDIEGYFDNY